MRRLTGIGASEGVSIGKVLLFREEEMIIPEVKAADSTIESELTKLEEGLKKSKTQLISIREKVKEKMGEDKAAIFDGHIMLLEDEDLLMEVQDKIKGEGMPAAKALKEGIDEYCEMISQLDDAYLRERAADLKDIGKRWLKNLLGIKIYDLSNLEPNTVVITYDLTPSDTAQLDLENCVGFITEVGGKTAHSAIMARSLELPAVVGVKGILSEAKEGETVIMDGEAGELFLAPEAELQSQYETKREILKKEWAYFSKLNNIGGRADCQDNREDFIIMRKSQWETFNEETLLSYLDDLNSKNNPLFQKYGQMMKYNSPQEYEKVKDILENPSKNKITLIEKIMSIYMEWEKEFFKKYPIFSSMGRPLYSTEDDNIETSIETYLRGELLSYSEKTLQLYLKYILEMKEKDINLAIKNMDNLANMQGFKNSDEVEEYYKNLQKN